MCSIFPLAHLNERIKNENERETHMHMINGKNIFQHVRIVHAVRITSKAFTSRKRSSAAYLLFSWFRFDTNTKFQIFFPLSLVEIIYGDIYLCHIAYGWVWYTFQNHKKTTSTMEPNEIRVDENEWTNNGKSISSSTHIFVRFFFFSLEFYVLKPVFFGRVSRTNNIWQA